MEIKKITSYIGVTNDGTFYAQLVDEKGKNVALTPNYDTKDKAQIAADGLIAGYKCAVQTSSDERIKKR